MFRITVSYFPSSSCSTCFSSASSFSRVRFSTADCTSNSSRVTRFILVRVVCSRLFTLLSMSFCRCFTSPGISELMRLLSSSSVLFIIIRILNSYSIVNQICPLISHQDDTGESLAHMFGASMNRFLVRYRLYLS